MTNAAPRDGPAGPLTADPLDEWRLSQLLTAYAIAVDERDWPALRSIFARGARVDYRRALGPAGPIEEILPWMEANLTRELLPRCQHMLSNLQVTVEGSQARGRADYLNPDVFATPEGGHRLVVHSGVYRAEFRREVTWQLTALVSELYWRHEPPPNEMSFLFLDPGR